MPILLKKIAYYMFLSLDIVDNYFPCTMKQFLRVSIKYRQSYCIFGETPPKNVKFAYWFQPI